MTSLYASIRCATGLVDHLLLDDDGDVLGELRDAFPGGAPGRWSVPPRDVSVIGELDGAEEHYAPDEIERARTVAPLPYEWHGVGYVVGDAFLSAIEAEGAHFQAAPLVLVQRGTQRRFPNFWLLIYTHACAVAKLRDDAIPIVVDDGVAFYAQRVRDRILALGWPWLQFMPRG
jgi:hypothetical protein